MVGHLRHSLLPDMMGPVGWRIRSGPEGSALPRLTGSGRGGPGSEAARRVHRRCNCHCFPVGPRAGSGAQNVSADIWAARLGYQAAAAACHPPHPLIHRKTTEGTHTHTHFGTFLSLVAQSMTSAVQRHICAPTHSCMYGCLEKNIDFHLIFWSLFFLPLKTALCCCLIEIDIF